MSLSSNKLPRTVVSFGGNLFGGCREMNEIDFSENPNFVFIGGMLMDREMMQIISCNCSKSGGYSIPSTVKAICRCV